MIVGSYLPLISGGGLQCKSIVDNLNKKVNFTIFTTIHNYKNLSEVIFQAYVHNTRGYCRSIISGLDQFLSSKNKKAFF